MQLGIEGDGVLARAVRAEADRRGWTTAAAGDAFAGDAGADAVVLARPTVGEVPPRQVPTVGAAVRQADARQSPADVPVAGWWGGLGTLLAGAALEVATEPQELHVAYGLLGGATAWRRASAALRTDVARAAMEPAQARVRGEVTDEQLGEGRRLAWFPAPVGPAHAVAVGGLEHSAGLEVPTVRTWLAAGSLAAEGLQAVGRRDPDSGIGAWLVDRASSGGGGPGATADLRWAVVVEVRDLDDAGDPSDGTGVEEVTPTRGRGRVEHARAGRDGTVVRAWANGTDPVTCAAVLLAGAADRARSRWPTAGGQDGRPKRSLLDLGPPVELLDELADARALRWSIGHPTPARR